MLQPISIDTGSADREGMLVVASGMLVAVLVRLDAPEHEHGGAWFIEAAFGRLQGVKGPTFVTLEDATRWFRLTLKR